MATDNIALTVTVEEIMNAYTPVYNPLFALISNQVAYEEKIGQVKLVEVEAGGDLSAKTLEAQDTENKHFSVLKKSKVFNKYFKGIKYIESGMQEAGNIETITGQILDRHLQQLDKDIFYGDPVNGVIQNNGLYVSNDVNFTELEAVSGQELDLDALKLVFDEVIDENDAYSGTTEKYLILVGEVQKKLSKFIQNQSVTFKTALEQSYDGRIKFVTCPKNLVNEGDSGILCLNPDAIVLRYTKLPTLEGQGYNQENNYTWLNYVYGSAMVDVRKKSAAVKRQITFKA